MLEPLSQEGARNALAKHRQGDEWLTRELAKQGVEVVNRSSELRAKAGIKPPFVVDSSCAVAADRDAEARGVA